MFSQDNSVTADPFVDDNYIGGYVPIISHFFKSNAYFYIILQYHRIISENPTKPAQFLNINSLLCGLK